MVGSDFSAIRKLPPEERVKALVELERKRKADLKKEQDSAERDVKDAENMIKESLDEVAIQEELKRARAELQNRSRTDVEDVVSETRESKKEDDSLEKAVENVPSGRQRGEQRRMYLDALEEIERFSSAGRRPSRSDLREVYAAIKSMEENVAATVYGRGEDVSDMYKSQDNSASIWERVHGMPKDEFGYKERMESVLDHIYEMKKKSQGAYERSDH